MACTFFGVAKVASVARRQPVRVTAFNLNVLHSREVGQICKRVGLDLLRFQRQGTRLLARGST